MSEIEFKFLVTTIICEAKGDKVEFNGDSKGNDEGETFLVDVIDTGRTTGWFGRGNKIYEATKVSPEVFRERLSQEENKKLFIAVHGFATEPDGWMRTCKEIKDYKQEGTSKTFPRLVIPIIWPADKNNFATISIRYDKDQKRAKQAGLILSKISNIGNDFSVSVMCHSMGNRILLTYAEKETETHEQFDHVFMVAADVWEEVFNTRIIEKKSQSWYRRSDHEDAGLKLSKMVKKDNGGKIHVLHYNGDMALTGSFLENGGRRRLGLYGSDPQRVRGRMHEDIKDVIQVYDMSPFKESIKEKDSAIGHSYMASSAAIDYYMRDEFN